jgi:8-oxo-dGTP pyrophosphatase MutT (NUDIX family)
MTEFEKLVRRLELVLPDVGDGPAIQAEELQQAAVAMILRSNRGAAEMLIIKRAVRRGDHWSGNLALPGGRWQSEDSSLLDTAIRETDEEVGIDLRIGGARILGKLETITTRSPLIPKVQVTPFVAIAPEAFFVDDQGKQAGGMVLNHEVATAFWVPVEFLRQRGRSEKFSLTWMGQEREWPAYPTEHGAIWGMTEAMVSEFLALLAPGPEAL